MKWLGILMKTSHWIYQRCCFNSSLKSEVVTPKDEEIASTIIVNERFVVSTQAFSEYMMEDFCEVSGKGKATYVNKVSGWRKLAPSTLWIEGVSSIS